MAEEKIWEQQQGEPSDWYARFTTYLHLGPNRSYLEAYKKHAKTRKGSKTLNITPNWRAAIKKYNWDERGAAYDMHLEEIRIQQEEELLRQQVMNSGYALEWNRVLALEQMVKRLNDAVEEGRLFVKKKAGSVGYEEMDGTLLREWRGLLDDISKETGGRIKKVEQKVDASIDFAVVKEALLAKLMQGGDEGENK